MQADCSAGSIAMQANCLASSIAWIRSNHVMRSIGFGGAVLLE
jgi:hypothetical protein